jgi:hypothetical protein
VEKDWIKTRKLHTTSCPTSLEGTNKGAHLGVYFGCCELISWCTGAISSLQVKELSQTAPMDNSIHSGPKHWKIIKKLKKLDVGIIPVATMVSWAF